MKITAKNNEPFEKLLRRFKKSVEKDDIIKIYRNKQEFTPKSVQKQLKIKNKLRKSRENGKG
jgi:ribosomal protein S21|tara:strand:- start:922 stop:1107 length:186 start_codon:yes stop_codon:yes gene_type:complete